MEQTTVKKERVNILLIREVGVVTGTILLFSIFTAAIGKNWLSIASLKPLLHVTSLLGVMVVGQSLLIISGEFDLSVGSVFGLAGINFIAFIGRGLGVWSSFLIVMIISGLIGLLNAVVTLKGRVPSLIATLGSMFIFRGLAYFITAGFPATLRRGMGHHFLIRIFGGSFFLNNSLLWCLGLTLIFTFILSRTVFGNRVFGVGGDARSAWSRGVNVFKVKTTCFIICSMLAGFGGVLAVSELQSAHTTLGNRMELQAIASAVIGGVALTGGIGSIWGAVIGSLMLSMISSGLVMMGAPAYWFITFVGIVLVLGVLGNNALMGWARRRYFR